eukprot:scaffold1042_cov55-Cyclotella_meneghiniana.AAC.3
MPPPMPLLPFYRTGRLGLGTETVSHTAYDGGYPSSPHTYLPHHTLSMPSAAFSTLPTTFP